MPKCAQGFWTSGDEGDDTDHIWRLKGLKINTELNGLCGIVSSSASSKGFNSQELSCSSGKWNIALLVGYRSGSKSKQDCFRMLGCYISYLSSMDCAEYTHS